MNKETKQQIFDITLKGEIDFEGKHIKVLEGGFGANNRIMTVKQVAEIHDMEVKRVNELINNNIDEFEEGIDIIDLKKQVLSNDLFLENGLYTKAQWGNAKNIYILSEQGYMALVGLMRTDKAREVRKKFRRQYFAMRSELRKQDSYMIDDPIKRAERWIEEQKEKKELEEKIKEQEPKVEYHDEVLNNSELMPISVIAKDCGISAMKLNQMLKDKGVQYKKGEIWYIKAEYKWLIENGYCDYKSFPVEGSKPSLQWTEKGRKWILETFPQLTIKKIFE